MFLSSFYWLRIVRSVPPGFLSLPAGREYVAMGNRYTECSVARRLWGKNLPDLWQIFTAINRQHGTAPAFGSIRPLAVPCLAACFSFCTTCGKLRLGWDRDSKNACTPPGPTALPAGNSVARSALSVNNDGEHCAVVVAGEHAPTKLKPLVTQRRSTLPGPKRHNIHRPLPLILRHLKIITQTLNDLR